MRLWFARMWTGCKREEKVMEIRHLNDVSPALRDFYDRACEAAKRGDILYAVKSLTGVVQKAPAFAEARNKLRELEMQQLRTAGPKMVGLRNVFKLGAIRKCIASDPVKAMSMCEAELAFCLQNVEVLKALLEASQKAGADFITVETLDLLLEFAPSIAYADQLAEIYRKQNRLEDVVKLYQKFVGEHPDNQEYRDRLTQAAKAAGKEKSRRADNAEQESLTLQLEGGIIRDAGQAKILIEKFNRQLAEKDSMDVRRKLANAYMVAGEYDAAAHELELVQKNLGHPDAKLDKLIEKAYIAKLDQTIELLRTNPQAYENSETQLKEFTTAREEFRLYRAQKRLRLMPNDLGLVVDLADLYFERAEYDKAMEQYDSLCSAVQKRWVGNLGAARCLAAMNRLDEAVTRFDAALEEMLRMDRTRLVAMYEMARCCEQLGRRDKAVETYREIVKNNTKFRDVQKRLEDLGA